MRSKDIKMLLRYLHRFVEGPIFTRQKWVAFWRYTEEAFSLVYEKIVGLDYSMVYDTKDDNIHHSGYNKIPGKVLKRIFADVQDIENKGFIDVGCGKGYAVMKAAQRGFRISGGVEYNTVLYNIGIANLKKMQLSTEHFYNGDAKDFEHYGDFDVFLFCNSFDETIIEPVARKIYEARRGKECILYFLNPYLKPRTDAVENAGFNLVKQIPDPSESYFNMNVYTN